PVRAVPAALRALAARAVAALVVGPGRELVVSDAVFGTLIVPDPDRLAEEIGPRDHHLPLSGLEFGPDRRHAVRGLAVARELVGEAAHEPPAGAGDLAGIERELLVARHLERDRMELLEPGRAAEGAP